MKHTFNQKLFRGAAVMVLFALLLNTGAIYALDTEPDNTPVPEEPSELPTEEVVEDPAPTPTDAPADEPTDKPTEEPIEEPTDDPFASPTEEPTEEPTPEPTKAVELARLLTTKGKEVVPDQYLVIYKSDGPKVTTRSSTVQSFVSKAGGTVKHIYDAAINGYSAYLPPEALEKVRKDPNVDYIQPDIVGKYVDQTGTDDDIGTEGIQTNPTWGLDRIDQRYLTLDDRYVYQNMGYGVNVYVIDSGIHRTHDEFEGRAKHGYTAISDGLGSMDCNGHGTHVAGTIGSNAYGVAKKTTLYSVRVGGCDPTVYLSDIVAGINWVINNHSNPSVANISISFTANSALDTATNSLINAGVTVVVAAGNDDDNACNYSPARVPNAITVGATESDDDRSTFSNYGTCLDIFAPGTDILSTYYTSNLAYTMMSGTSMASPHVAGAAALFLNDAPSSTPSTVRSGLVNDATAGVVGNEGTGSPDKLLYTFDIGYVSTIPNPISPSGTISDRTPTFTWSSVPGAKLYNVELYRGTTLVYVKNVWKATSVTPTTELGYMNYKWRVASYVNGVWSSYSAYEPFYISPPGFYSSFTSNSNGWNPHSGGWLLSSGNYVAYGQVDKWSTTSHWGNYTNFTYQARMRRTGSQLSSNNIAIRGVVYPLEYSNKWDKQYTFQYSNNGDFSVFECNSSICTPLKGWTTSSAINKWGWNTLKVKATNKYFKFYINDTLVWQGSDASLYKGRVGLQMWRYNSDPSNTKLQVDWASLSTITTSGEFEEVVDTSDQVTLTGGSVFASPGSPD